MYFIHSHSLIENEFTHHKITKHPFNMNKNNIKHKNQSMNTRITLETQMGKPTLNGAQSISTISSYNVFLAFCSFSSPWPKYPLLMRVKDEIGDLRIGGMPTTMTLHFPFLILSLLFFFFFSFIFFSSHTSFLSYSTLQLHCFT
jgi:hypothetical protein